MIYLYLNYCDKTRWLDSGASYIVTAYDYLSQSWIYPGNDGIYGGDFETDRLNSVGVDYATDYPDVYNVD